MKFNPVPEILINSGTKPDVLLFVDRLFGGDMYKHSYSKCPNCLSERPPADCAGQTALYFCQCGKNWTVEYPKGQPIFTLINWLKKLPLPVEGPYYGLPFLSLCPVANGSELVEALRGAAWYLAEKGYFFEVKVSGTIRIWHGEPGQPAEPVKFWNDQVVAQIRKHNNMRLLGW